MGCSVFWEGPVLVLVHSRGTGKLLISAPALDKRQALRDQMGKPLIVRSAYHSAEHNRAVGGATRSKHLEGGDFDIVMSNHDPVAFEAAAREVGFLGFGFYPRSGFIHVDLGPARGGASGSRSGRLPSRPIARLRARCTARARPRRGPAGLIRHGVRFDAPRFSSRAAIVAVGEHARNRSQQGSGRESGAADEAKDPNAAGDVVNRSANGDIADLRRRVTEEPAAGMVSGVALPEQCGPLRAGPAFLRRGRHRMICPSARLPVC